jgi:hypothetical protein
MAGSGGAEVRTEHRAVITGKVEHARAYGSGVNVGLGAERLNLAAAAADHPPRDA